MKNVLLLFGGESSEHEVSIASAKNVVQAIASSKYATQYVYIDKQGTWWLVGEVSGDIGPDAQRIVLDLDAKTITAGDLLLTPDVVFPCLHGKNGEDGVIQRLVQTLGVAIVGCGVTASEVCIDKVASKRIAEANGIAIVPYAVYEKGQPEPTYDALALQLSASLFVKPSRAGSSVGAHKVGNQQELADALADALSHDDVVLIEASVDPRELEVAVLGVGDGAKASPVGEIIPEGEFYSYESKYDPASTSSAVIPADISGELSDSIREKALVVYRALGCEGLSRVDFFVDKNSGELYFNEINTMPGFTNISMYPKLWEQVGVSNEQLMDELLTIALTRN